MQPNRAFGHLVFKFLISRLTILLGNLSPSASFWHLRGHQSSFLQTTIANVQRKARQIPTVIHHSLGPSIETRFAEMMAASGEHWLVQHLQADHASVPIRILQRNARKMANKSGADRSDVTFSRTRMTVS